MGILALTEIETGELIDLDTDLVMITSVTHNERGTLIMFETKHGAGNPVRHEHHVRESFNQVIDALAKASQQTERVS
jgi:hypothetical protein